LQIFSDSLKARYIYSQIQVIVQLTTDKNVQRRSLILVAMDDHGELRLVEEIDTDKEHNLWTIEVEVLDKGMPRLDTFVQVNVFVEDVDDYKPTWHPANNGSYQACKL
jgi:hypothetical protein